MANSDIGSDEPIDKRGNRPDEPIITQSKPIGKRTGNRTGKRTGKRTGSPSPAPTAQPAETEVILDEVVSGVARDNVDIRLKAASIESLPDEGILVAGATTMLMLLLDGIGMMAFGDFARLNDNERMMINEPLSRMLAKISPTSLNAISKYTDPLLLSMGLLSWVSRVTNEARSRKDADKKPEPEPDSVELKPEAPQPVKNESQPMTFPPDEITGNFATTGIIQ